MQQVFKRAGLILAGFAMVVSVGVGMVGQANAITFDLADDWSSTNGNPNGVWTYGHYTGGLDQNTFDAYLAFDTVLIGGGGILEVARDAVNPADPNIIKNVGVDATAFNIDFHGDAVTFGPTDGPAVARLITPFAGTLSAR